MPAAIKRSALKSACVVKWKKARAGIARARLAIITPSCLRVDRAIIFFMSVSASAFNLAMVIVSVAEMPSSVKNRGDFSRMG